MTDLLNTVFAYYSACRFILVSFSVFVLVWFGYEKSDMDQKTVLCELQVPTRDINSTNLLYHLCKNRLKQYGETLLMTGTKVQLSTQNKPQTGMMKEVRMIIHAMAKKKWKEITAAVNITKEMGPVDTVEKMYE